MLLQYQIRVKDQIRRMAKAETAQATALNVPVFMRNGRMDYNCTYIPLPADTIAPFLRNLHDSRDIYGRLYQYAVHKDAELSHEQKASLAITTLLTLGQDGRSPLKSFTEEARIVLHFLAETEEAADKAAFLRDTFGVDHVEAEFAIYPLPETQQPPYDLFTHAAAINNRLMKEERHMEGPTWFDMHVLSVHQSLLAENHLPTSQHIRERLPTRSTSIKAIETSLKRLEAMGEITRQRSKSRIPVKSAAEVIPDKSHVLVVKSDTKPSTRRKGGFSATLLTTLIA